MARELSIVVTAETQQAEPALERVEARLRGVEVAAEKADKATDKLEDSQRQAAQSAQTQSIGVAKLTTALQTYAGPAAIGLALRRTLDLADQIKELSQQSGFSTDAIQTLGHVANKAGSSFQAVANAANQLDRNLQQGGARMVTAVSKLGFEVDDLLSMRPEDRFRALGIAIGDTADPAERAEIAMTLFGLAGRDLLPMFDDLAQGAEENAPKMSQAWVDGLSEIRDALDDLMAHGSNVLNWFLGWPVVLSNWAANVGATLRSAWDNIAPNVPRMPGRPTSPLLAAPGISFDPLGGQSMGFLEQQLTRSAQEQIRARTRAASGGITPYSPLEWRSLYTNPQAILAAQRGILTPNFAFPGFATPLPNRMNLGFGGANVNGSGFWMNRPSVAMNAPGGGGGGFFGNMFGSVTGGLKSMWQGMTGGNGVGGLLGNLGSGLLTGGLSSLLGMGIGFLGKGIGKLFGGLFGGEGKKTNRTRDAWIRENFGSVDALREAADKAGFSVDRMLSVKKVKDFEAEVKKLQGAMGESEADAQRVGEAMERWGLTIDDMGPKFKQTKINDVFKEALDDLRVLTNAGADFNVIAEKMAPQLGALVHEAIEMGGTVPREMEPILRKMIELGLLTDKNGEKFTELSDIPFAADLNKDFQTLISKMDALISRISELPGLFNDATDAANDFANAAPGADGMPTRPDGGNETTAGFDVGGVAGRDWRQRSLRDTIPAWLRPGEVVLTPEQARGGMSVTINGLSVGGGMTRGETAEQVGKAVVAYMERRGVRFGRRVA